MIQINDLSKKFGKLTVLNTVTCQFDQGSVTAVVGPNGSGKTTMIKCILGLIKADTGTITINGNRLNGDWRYRRQIGYMPQQASFPENLTVGEIIRMVKDIRSTEIRYDQELYDQFGLELEKSKKLKTLSGGTRQKLSSMIAFLFDPQILILDEPTAGLDPAARTRLKDKILQEKSKGKTLIITSHIMSELEELSDYLVFMLEGRIRFEGTVQTIMNDTHEKKLERAVAGIMEKLAV